MKNIKILIIQLNQYALINKKKKIPSKKKITKKKKQYVDAVMQKQSKNKSVALITQKKKLSACQIST